MQLVRKAFTWDELLDIRRALEANEITYHYEQEKGELGAFLNPDYEFATYLVFVEEKDSEKAMAVLNEYFENPVEENLEEDLTELEEEDLVDRITYKEAYTDADREKAIEELNRRGLEGDKLVKTVAKKVREVNTPQSIDDLDLLFNFLSVFTLAGGIKTGYKLMHSKNKHTMTGEDYYTYDEHSRKMGKIILIASIIVTILVLFFAIKVLAK